MSKTKSNKKLKSLIKESVREVLSSEIMKLRASAISGVSDQEQKDIEQRYGTPGQKEGRKVNACQ